MGKVACIHNFRLRTHTCRGEATAVGWVGRNVSLLLQIISKLQYIRPRAFWGQGSLAPIENSLHGNSELRLQEAICSHRRTFCSNRIIRTNNILRLTWRVFPDGAPTSHVDERRTAWGLNEFGRREFSPMHHKGSGRVRYAGTTGR